MEQFNEIDPTAEDLPREMGLQRALFLLIASLLLWCGSMLLVLDLANTSGNQGQVALIGLSLVAIGGSCLWADFFEVTTWFARAAAKGSTISSRLKPLLKDLTAQTEMWIRSRMQAKGLRESEGGI